MIGKHLTAVMKFPIFQCHIQLLLNGSHKVCHTIFYDNLTKASQKIDTTIFGAILVMETNSKI